MSRPWTIAAALLLFSAASTRAAWAQQGPADPERRGFTLSVPLGASPGPVAPGRVMETLRDNRLGAFAVVNLPRPAREALLNGIRIGSQGNALRAGTAGGTEHPDAAADGRIVGGRPANPGELPWQVALLLAAFNDDHRVAFCGGSLIGERHVLTAAHCVRSDGIAFGEGDVDVLVGALDYAKRDSGERIKVSGVALHPAYDENSYEHDLAVLTLDRPAKLGAPIALLPPSLHPLAAGSALTISGWGYTTNTGDSSTHLQIASVPVATSVACNGAAAHAGRVKADMFCAGLPNGGVDACKGDSGGPAVYSGPASAPHAPMLYGVVSWGAKGRCAAANKYGVYAAVPAAADWVSQRLGHVP